MPKNNGPIYAEIGSKRLTRLRKYLAQLNLENLDLEQDKETQTDFFKKAIDRELESR